MAEIPIDDEPGFVYIIHAKGTNLYKIGLTTNRPRKRMKQMQTSSPHKLAIYAAAHFTHCNHTEEDMHNRFSDKRVNGEWFEFSEEEANAAADTLLAESLENRGIEIAHYIFEMHQAFANIPCREGQMRSLLCKALHDILHTVTLDEGIDAEDALIQLFGKTDLTYPSTRDEFSKAIDRYGNCGPYEAPNKQ